MVQVRSRDFGPGSMTSRACGSASVLYSLRKGGRQDGCRFDAEGRIQMHVRAWAEKAGQHPPKMPGPPPTSTSVCFSMNATYTQRQVYTKVCVSLNATVATQVCKYVHALCTQRLVHTHVHASGHPEATTHTHTHTHTHTQVCTCAQASARVHIHTHRHTRIQISGRFEFFA